MVGFLPPESGSVRIDGRSVAVWPRRELARRVALIPQELHLPFDTPSSTSC
jgi:iron complex transport system ATP-binding protein